MTDREPRRPDEDLQDALECNPVFDINKITNVIACIPGANDEFDWYWVIEDDDDGFWLLDAWCDYTGWGCQSGVHIHGPYDWHLDAAGAAPEIEKDSGRFIRRGLITQIKGDRPYGVYWGED